jgi:hypothetical protein
MRQRFEMQQVSHYSRASLSSRQIQKNLLWCTNFYLHLIYLYSDLDAINKRFALFTTLTKRDSKPTRNAKLTGKRIRRNPMWISMNCITNWMSSIRTNKLNWHCKKSRTNSKIKRNSYSKKISSSYHSTLKARNLERVKESNQVKWRMKKNKNSLVRKRKWRVCKEQMTGIITNRCIKDCTNKQL